MPYAHGLASRLTPRLTGLLCALVMAGVATPVIAQAGKEKAARHYEDAQVRFDRKDIPGAIVQLKNALQADKSLLPVQLLLARALMIDGQAVAAEVAVTEALRLGVDRAEIAVTLGQSLLAQGKHRQMLEHASLAPAGLPNSVRMKVLLLRATAFSGLGEEANALKAVAEARSIGPDAAETWLAEVPLRLRARQFKEATAAADAALKLTPTSAEAHYQRGSIAHLRSDLPAAIESYGKALSLDPNHTESRIARAGLYIDTRRDAEALADIEEARKRSPREPRAAYMKALLLERAGQRAPARAALGEVVGLLDPVPIDFIRYRPQLLLLAGLAHFALDEYGKALPFLELFHRAQPGTPASKVLSQIYMRENNPDRAIDVLEPYVRSFPNDSQALTQLSAAYLVKGRPAKATQLMQDALKSRDAPEYHTVLGIAMNQSGDSSGALAQLDATFRKDPRQIQAGLALVPLLLRQGEAARAVQVADQMLKQRPDDAALLNLAGIAKAQAGDFGGARRNFDAALARDGKLIAPQLGLARLDIATTANDSAMQRLKAILKADERNVEALYDMAALLQRMGKLEDAQRTLERASGLATKSDPRPDFALIELHLRQNRASAALDVAKGLLAKVPDDVRVLHTYARVQLAQGDNLGARQTLVGASRRAGFNAEQQTEVAALQMAAGDDAAAAYSLDKALSASADFVPALVLQARLELGRNEPAKAEARARRIVQLQPKLPVGYQLLGDVASARGQTRAAIDAYRQAYKAQPTSATTLALLRLLSAQGEAAETRSTASQWLKANPRDLNIRKALADHLARQGDFSAARTEYETILKTAPGDAEVLNNLANALLQLKDVKAALAVAERAVARSPTNAIVMDTLGWTLVQDGQHEAALIKLRDARLRAPANPEIRYHLAVALARSGKRAEAREEVSAALQDHPNFESRRAADALLGTLK
ncbi:MAG: PEP-CTERM system TPR-repeat protein PrsT [Rubrivivax sp.]|nr:MAG: PEP-CTERM system TPR-repeat protein PrsT [Rubrivivax sp.]